MAGLVLHQPSFSKATLELQVAFPVDKSCAPATEFSFPNRWRARSPTLYHPKHSIPDGLRHPRRSSCPSALAIDGAAAAAAATAAAAPRFFFLAISVASKYGRNFCCAEIQEICRGSKI